jgi:L-iditol 2-dehydrogenase
VAGAIQEYGLPGPRVFALPPELSFVDGAMLEPLCIAVKSLDFGKLRVGETAAVIGCGPIGLLIIQLLRPATAIYAAIGWPTAVRPPSPAPAPLTRPTQCATCLIAPAGGVDVAFEAAGSSSTAAGDRDGAHRRADGAGRHSAR